MIELKNIAFSYGKKELILGLDLEIKKGELCAVVGKNGCGKTTLLRLAASLTKPRSGEVLLDGTPIHRFRKKELAKHISYFPQSRPVPDMSVYELVSFGRFPFGGSGEEKVREALEFTDTIGLADRNLAELSFGERQRVYLAMLLSQDADYLFLDEPCAFLDVASELAAVDIFKKVAESGKGVVAVMHSLPTVLESFDRIVVMKDGRVIGDGDADAVIASGAIKNAFGIEYQRIDFDGKSAFVLR